jgi:hypothetical protein
MTRLAQLPPVVRERTYFNHNETAVKLPPTVREGLRMKNSITTKRPSNYRPPSAKAPRRYPRSVSITMKRPSNCRPPSAKVSVCNHNETAVKLPPTVRENFRLNHNETAVKLPPTVRERTYFNHNETAVKLPPAVYEKFKLNHNETAVKLPPTVRDFNHNETAVKHPQRFRTTKRPSNCRPLSANAPISITTKRPSAFNNIWPKTIHRLRRFRRLKEKICEIGVICG